MKHREMEEGDYLAGTQLESDPNGFVQLVREAYALEFGVRENQEIAEIVGKDKSRITQIFKQPRKVMAETISYLVAPLSTRQQQRIVKAWVKLCFGLNLNQPGPGRTVKPPITEKTLKRIDMLFRQSRYREGAYAAFQAAYVAEDIVLRERLWDRALFAFRRINVPGQALAVARHIALGAKERGDVRRECAAHFWRAQILARIPSVRPEELTEILDRIDAALAIAPPPPAVKSPYVILTTPILPSARMSIHLLRVEHGLEEVNAEYLRAHLEAVSLRAKKGKSYQDRYHACRLLARMHLALGENFKAKELVDEAFKQGELANLDSLDECAILHGRILVTESDIDAAARYLVETSTNCWRHSLLSERAEAEMELVKVVNRAFPTLIA